jgi:hypothetical protein
VWHGTQGDPVAGFLPRFSLSLGFCCPHETPHNFLNVNQKKRVANRGEGGPPLSASLTCPRHVVKLFLKKSLGSPGIKNFFAKSLTFPLSSEKILPMKNKWIPRSQRWTSAERQEKKLQAKNARELRIMFWRESQAFRLQIEKEISEKILAKRAALE